MENFWFLLQKGVLLLFSYFVSFFWVFSLLPSVSAFQLQIHCKTIKPNTFDKSMKLYNYLVVFDALRWLNENSKFLSLGAFSKEYNFWAKKCNAGTLVRIKRHFSKQMWASLLFRVPIFFVIKCQLYFRMTQNGESSETQEFDLGSYWQRSEYFSKTQTNLTQKGNCVAQNLGQIKISLGLDSYIDVEKTPLLIWEFLWVSWSIQKTMNLIFLINFENRMFDKKNGRQIRYFAEFRSISTAVKVKKIFHHCYSMKPSQVTRLSFCLNWIGAILPIFLNELTLVKDVRSNLLDLTITIHVIPRKSTKKTNCKRPKHLWMHTIGSMIFKTKVIASSTTSEGTWFFGSKSWVFAREITKQH